MNKTALITGIYGQDAFYLRKKLLNLGYDVFGTTRMVKKISVENNKKIIQTDYSQKDLINILTKNQIDVIFHLCGQSKVALSWMHLEETIESQANIAIRFIQIIKEKKLPIKFINTSSSEIFALNKDERVNENSNFKPINPYGVAQLFSFNVCAIFREKYDMFISNAILFPHESIQRDKLFVTKKIISTLSRISKGSDEKLYLGNIDSIRDWGHAEEFMDALILMAESEKADDYCICTSEGMTVRKILDYCLRFFNLDLNEHVIFDSELTRYKEHESIIGDYSKIKKQLGWKPNYVGELLIDKLLKEEIEGAKE